MNALPRFVKRFVVQNPAAGVTTASYTFDGTQFFRILTAVMGMNNPGVSAAGFWFRWIRAGSVTSSVFDTPEMPVPAASGFVQFAGIGMPALYNITATGNNNGAQVALPDVWWKEPMTFQAVFGGGAATTQITAFEFTAELAGA